MACLLRSHGDLSPPSFIFGPKIDENGLIRPSAMHAMERLSATIFFGSKANVFGLNEAADWVTIDKKTTVMAGLQK